MFARDEVERFLSALVTDAPENSHYLIWSLPKKYSSWYPGGSGSIGSAVNYVEGVTKRGGDCYFGVGLSPQKHSIVKRCKAEDINGIMGLWADLDIADAVHRKSPQLPPDEDAVMELIDSVGLKPTILIHSGHGIQAWWLFHEPWIFDNDRERVQAAKLAAGWVYTFQTHAATRGWVVDPTVDLARIMRLPGTVNFKDKPVPVRILDLSNDCRYCEDDFRERISEEAWHRVENGDVRVTRAHAIGMLKLDATARPPEDKFQAIMDNDEEFAALWEHKKKLRDSSMSGYDFALAVATHAAGWTEQEIVDLLICHRAKFNYPSKLREDYYQRTINAVMKDNTGDVNTEVAISNLEEINTDPDVKDDDRRRNILAELGEMFKVPLRRFVRYETDPPTYRLYASGRMGEERSVFIPSSECLLSQSQFTRLILDASQIVVPSFKSEKWRRIVQLLLDCADVETVSEEATEAGEIYSVLKAFLFHRVPASNAQEGYEGNRPFVDNGKIWFVVNDLIQFSKVNQHVQWRTSRDVCLKLKSVNGESRKFNVKKRDGGRTSFQAWTVTTPIEDIFSPPKEEAV